jgi:aspartyl/asparaginyl beta-hydroxylase (cupin superfamily)
MNNLLKDIINEDLPYIEYIKKIQNKIKLINNQLLRLELIEYIIKNEINITDNIYNSIETKINNLNNNPNRFKL